jgi:hypothetical protein
VVERIFFHNEVLLGLDNSEGVQLMCEDFCYST